ncbi:MAG: hypothetical protein K2Y05_00585, partial [Hyphomicrobiaceae bacterium]|nr:hypothetical protein [Hyphomicrobiaceae bacterium]
DRDRADIAGRLAGIVGTARFLAIVVCQGIPFRLVLLLAPPVIIPVAQDACARPPETSLGCKSAALARMCRFVGTRYPGATAPATHYPQIAKNGWLDAFVAADKAVSKVQEDQCSPPIKPAFC